MSSLVSLDLSLYTAFLHSFDFFRSGAINLPSCSLFAPLDPIGLIYLSVFFPFDFFSSPRGSIVVVESSHSQYTNPQNAQVGNIGV